MYLSALSLQKHKDICSFAVSVEWGYEREIIEGILYFAGGLFFAIGRELFSGQSPSGIYGRALKLIRRNDDVSQINLFVILLLIL